MAKMPKQRRKRRIQELQRQVSKYTVDEPDDETLETMANDEIKFEPVDTGCEYESMECVPPKTVIYTENDENVAAVEAEIGLESQIELMKTEVDVNEEIVNEFREEMMQMSSGAATNQSIQPKLKNHENHCHTGRRRLECYLCNYSHSELTIMKMHMRKHTGEKPFQCEYCQKFYPRPEALRQHVQTHRDLLKFKCDQCLRRFLKPNELEQHVGSCRRRRYECYICGHSKFGISFSSFRRHMNVHTTPKCGGKIFMCHLCPRKFQLEHNLKVHIKSHTKIGLLKCDYCDKQFADIKYKKKHEFQCKKVFECYLCKGAFPSFRVLQRTHMRTHLGTYNCTHCTKTFASVRTYTLHVLDVHLHQYKFECNTCNEIIEKRQDIAKHQRSCMKPIRQAAGITYFKCSLCGLGLPRVPELRQHILNAECTNHPKRNEKPPTRKGKIDFIEMEEEEGDKNDEHSEIKEIEPKNVELQPLDIVVNEVKMAKCHFCNFQLISRNRSLVKEHMRLHTGFAPYACRHCPQKFTTRNFLLQHIHRDHRTKRKYKCPLCKVWFFAKNDIESHELKCVKRRSFECHLCKHTTKQLYMHKVKDHIRKEHTGEEVYQCDYCEEAFVTKSRLRSHELQHPDAVPFKCFNCKGRFTTEEKLKNHESICLNRRRFECHLCQYTYAKLFFEGMRAHMRKHTGEKPFPCPYCEKFFPRSEALAHHIQRHRDLFNIKCAQCHRRFINADELKQHEGKCRRRRYECYLCGHSKFGISFSCFRKHMNVHTTPKFGHKFFMCHLCPRKFQMEYNLKAHIKSHTKIGLLKCDYCNKQFAGIKDKKKHEFRCKQVYECYLCKEKFPSFPILKGIHMRTHLGAKPYNCTHCTKTFASIRTYTLHVLAVHLPQYKFKCNTCNGIMEKKQDVRKHQRSCMKPIRKSAGIIYFKCSLCGLGLPRVPELRQHILNAECAKHPKKFRKN